MPNAGDLSTPERFTGQWRLDAGGGNPARELYRFGDQGAPSRGEGSFAAPLLSAGRSYLPGVGIVAQPDALVTSLANPQTLNRYAYAVNNPLRYSDATGRAPAQPGREAALALTRRDVDRMRREERGQWLDRIVDTALDRAVRPDHPGRRGPAACRRPAPTWARSRT